MKVKELIEILKDYDEDAHIQINVSDEVSTVGFTDISIDEEYSPIDALVLGINLDGI